MSAEADDLGGRDSGDRAIGAIVGGLVVAVCMAVGFLVAWIVAPPTYFCTGVVHVVPVAAGVGAAPAPVPFYETFQHLQRILLTGDRALMDAAFSDAVRLRDPRDVKVVATELRDHLRTRIEGELIRVELEMAVGRVKAVVEDYPEAADGPAAYGEQLRRLEKLR